MKNNARCLTSVIFKDSLLILFLSISFLCRGQSVRKRENFDSNWQFHKGDIAMYRAIKAGMQGGLTDQNVKVVEGEYAKIAYTDKNAEAVYHPSDWKKVDLPHDWLVEEPFVNSNINGLATRGFLPGGIGFYRKEFEVPESDEGKKISIEFDGIFRNSTVWVNGHLMGNHKSGYTPSVYDLTEVLRYGNEGKNVILVKVDATDYEGWWYEGAGIYRHTWMVKTNKVHVARFGTYVTTPSVSLEKATVNIRTKIQNEENKAKEVELVSKIVEVKSGKVVDSLSSFELIVPYCQEEFIQNGVIENPKLWSPETPDLYKVLTEIWDKGNLSDNYETVFGVRTIAFTDKGFFLNGKSYSIRGTANHQDFAGVGTALPDKLNEYKIKLLKEMGSNGYRCAHNPPTPELLDACDRQGMLVLDENRLLSSSKEGLEDLKTLVYRDRNHPCVFLWNMENEEILEGTVMGRRILEKMVSVVHKIDPSRLVTAAMNHGWNDNHYSDMVDIVGYNYGQRNLQYVKDHVQYPKRKMLVTESTSFVSTRGEYLDDRKGGLVSNLGNGVPWSMIPGEDWFDIVKYPYLGGMFAWTGFDYRGEPTPYSWPCVSSHFGIMDLCGFPKDGYYAYKAAWNSKPLVHIFPHWNWHGKEGKKIRMACYTNCDEVVIRINGKTMNKLRVSPFKRLMFEEVYRPGKIEVIGYKNGRIVTKDIEYTSEVPSRVSLKSDCNILASDGVDVAIVNISINDKKGHVVLTADNLVHFVISGPGKIIGVGNGNPSSHESDKSLQRKAFNGYCQVLIQSRKQSGIIHLKAVSDGLKYGEVTLVVR